MMHTRVWLCLMLSCLGVTARYLPTPELIVDSLVPFTATSGTSRAVRSIEGSGAGGGEDDLVSIRPLPLGQSLYMERMELAPEDSKKQFENLDEGSGAEPLEIGRMLKEIDDPIEDTFAKEPGMEVLEDLNKPVGLPREDDNRQGNSLNVLPSNDRPETRIDEEDRHEVLDEGSGQSDSDVFDAKNVPIIDLDNETNITVTDTAQVDDESEQVKKDEERNNTTETPAATTLSEETTSEEFIPSEIPDVAVSEAITEGVTSEDSERSETTSVEAEPTTSITGLLHSEGEEVAAAPTTVHIPVEPEISTPIQSLHPSTESPISENPVTTETIVTSSLSPEVEILKKSEDKVVLMAAKEATVLEKSLNEEEIDEASGPKNLSTILIVAGLIVAFLSIIIVVVMRKRHKTRLLQDELTAEGETSKALLANGKYKSETEDVKNNEISPLVINKFEKSPNFSSQKNLNTVANDKNIEKDNVLKQAIIEDEVEEAKKAVEDVLEGSKRAAEELRGDPEKVVVRTHIDLDSIPRKPLIVTKNGNTYHSVPNGET